MVYHIALLIFNMVSEPNFVLGIKQKSLASKEDSHVHITIRNHTCLSAGSRLHSISQPPWLTAVSRSSNQASHDLTYQICANPSFSCQNQPHRRAPRPPARKTQKFGQPKASHVLPRAAVSSRKSTTCGLRFLTSRSCLCTCAAMTASSSTNLLGLRIWWSTAVARASTRHLGF